MIVDEYAKALYDLTNKDRLKEVDEELDIILQALDLNPDAKKIFTYPNISVLNKHEMIGEIAKDCDDTLKRFLYVLIDNNEFKNIKDIYKAFHNLVVNIDNVCDVLVKSAKKLTKEQLSNVEKLLKLKLGDKKINIENIVDESLIGGIKCEYKGHVIDLSAKAKLESLKASL